MFYKKNFFFFLLSSVIGSTERPRRTSFAAARSKAYRTWCTTSPVRLTFIWSMSVHTWRTTQGNATQQKRAARRFVTDFRTPWLSRTTQAKLGSCHTYKTCFSVETYHFNILAWHQLLFSYLAFAFGAILWSPRVWQHKKRHEYASFSTRIWFHRKEHKEVNL